LVLIHLQSVFESEVFYSYLGPSDHVYHPFFSEYRLTSITVLQVYKSKLKPALVTVGGDWETQPSLETKQKGLRFIYKVGDDLRLDLAVLSCFRLFNYIWEKEGGFGAFNCVL